jgi:serine/threonine-protein kinase PpkA
MSASVTRRSMMIGIATLLETKAQATSNPSPAAAPPPSSSSARPLTLPGKTTLFQRIVTHPGATLVARPEPQGQQEISGFEVFYVYNRQGGNTGWVQVGRSADGRIDGWIPAQKSIEWRQTLVGAFVNPAGRQRVLFLDSPDAERDLLLEAHPGDVAAHMLAEAQAGRPGHVIAREPDNWANIEDHFYLLPVLSSTPIERETGPTLRLLEVISAPAPPTPPPRQDFKAAVVFLVDTTLSMQAWIDGTRNVLRQMVGRIRSTPIGERFRFGLVAYRDSLEDSPRLEYYAKVYAKPDFGQPSDAILPAIAQVKESTVSSSGFDEDPIGGLKMTLDEIDWNGISPGFRHVILITDAAARPGNHPHSVTRTGITEIKQLANQAGIMVWVMHLLTPGGASHDDFPLAARQYRELAALNASTSLYFPIPEGPPGALATQAQFESQADSIARRLITMAAETSHSPPVDFGAARGPESQQLQRQWPVIREAVQLAYLGHTQQTTAPEAVRSWTTDRDLADPNLTSLSIRVLLTKNQLSDLAQTLKSVLLQGRAGQHESLDFFNRLRQAVATSFRDPQETAQATQIGGLLGEYLDDLPYKSELLRVTEDEWRAKTPIEQDAIFNHIDEKLALYSFYNERPDHWYDLGNSRNPNESVFPVPIEALP